MTYLSTKKLAVLFTAFAVCIAAGSSTCYALPPASPGVDPTAAVSTQYSQINDAIIRHDLDKIMSFFTEDFTEVNSSGNTVDRDQERKEYQSQLARIKSMDIHYSIQNCSVTPQGTCCDVRFHMDGIGFKRVLFMKLQGSFTNDLEVKDVWVSTPDGLRLKSRQTILDQTKIAAG